MGGELQQEDLWRKKAAIGMKKARRMGPAWRQWSVLKA
jgi:hypothetical protein